MGIIDDIRSEYELRKHRRERKIDYQNTTAFLEQNGSRINSFDEIVESGDLIAVVDDRIGGFYAFVTNGYESVDRKRIDQSIDTSIDLYNQDLFDLDTPIEGNIK